MTATLETAGPVGDAPPEPSDRRDWRQRLQPLVSGRGGWVATLLVALFGGLLRFVRLDIPGTGVGAEAGTFGRGKIFDEIYYACDAQNLLRHGVELATVEKNADCVLRDPVAPAFVVHPPLGKWAIALGQWLFGEQSSFGWRFSAALFGTLTIVVLIRAARRMTGSTLLGCLAGVLLSLDALHFVQSRVAMLDVFLCFWVVAAFACLVVDRDVVRARLAGAPEVSGWGPRLGGRLWLVAGGLCLGAAVATKWSALYYVVVLALLAFAWEVGARRTAGTAAPVRATLVRSLVPMLAALVVLPALLYVLSWSGWFLTDGGYDRQWAKDHPATGLAGLVPDGLRSWWQYHVEIFQFHDELRSPHPYSSHPVGWLLLARPVSYYYPPGVGPGEYGCTVASCAREVLAIGNPAIWWASIPMLLVCTWMWVSRRDWRAGAVVILVLTAIVPWVRDDLDGRTMFLFYALPAVPFLCLGIALVAGWALGGPDTGPRRRATAAALSGVYVAIVLLVFVWLYPVIAAQTLPYDEWRTRMLLSSWI